MVTNRFRICSIIRNRNGRVTVGDGGETVRLPPSSAWSFPPELDPVCHAYTLRVLDPSLLTVTGLLLRSLPFAIAHLAVLLLISNLVIVWLAGGVGGAAWLGEHIASAFGWVWALGCLFMATYHGGSKSKGNSFEWLPRICAELQDREFSISGDGLRRRSAKDFA
jgi:hypothetical protein